MLSARLPLVIFVPCMLPIKIPGRWEFDQSLFGERPEMKLNMEHAEKHVPVLLRDGPRAELEAWTRSLASQ
jgi:hypothetical protein